MTQIKTKDIEIPQEKFAKWQNAVDILAETLGVESAAITRVDDSVLEMLVVNEKGDSSVQAGDKWKLDGLFCEQVIKSDEKLLVPNALKDKRWQDKPGLETGLISYLGFPIDWPDGDSFGTICVHDKKENHYKPEWEELMEQFKELIESNLEVIYKNHRLSTSLDKGFKMHQKFLPKKLPAIKNILIDSYYQPAVKLGGDFYNFVPLENKLLVYLVDVSGHNLDGAITNIFLREVINNYLLLFHQAAESLSPKKLIQFVVRRYKKEKFMEEQLISLLVGVLDLETMNIKFSNAGFQIPPLVIDKSGEVASIKCTGPPISLIIDEEIYENLSETEFKFREGSTLFLTTDGLIEERVEGSIYGEEKVKKILQANYWAAPDLINYRIQQDFARFSGSLKGQDDLTYLTLKREAANIDKYELELKSKREEILKLKPKIKSHVKTYDENHPELWLGLQEIICNAVEHGNQWAEEKVVKVNGWVTDNYIKFTVEDEGSGFDWRQKLEEEKTLLAGDERGRGIKIACAAYDEVWYNEQGNKVTLIKRKR